MEAQVQFVENVNTNNELHWVPSYFQNALVVNLLTLKDQCVPKYIIQLDVKRLNLFYLQDSLCSHLSV